MIKKNRAHTRQENRILLQPLLATLLFSLFGSSWSLSAGEIEQLYVQPVHAELKQDPQFNAKKVMDLKRGNLLQVIKKEGNWVQVRFNQKSGWVSKLFLNSQKPLKEAELNQELARDENLAKASRRRASSYTVSAATRGLTSSNRTRNGREKYPSDFSGVEKLNQIKVEDKKLLEFKKEGQLSP
ncbi:MAG: SH3 domain-containing protein [Bdellovibrionia bacterium]